ncbi:MAG: Rieske (2Fe-2S) protein [Gemmataceae bacterium]
MNEDVRSDLSEDNPPADRRTFLSLASTAAMTTGLAASYGTLGYLAGRYLYTAAPANLAWLFVAEAAKVQIGDVVRFVTPAGHKVTLTRRGDAGTADDFLALSSTCPHLGCQVHWEPQNNRFFCPCHNGAFDPAGNATAGPPAEARQSLPHYPLKVERGLIFIEAPVSVVGATT